MKAGQAFALGSILLGLTAGLVGCGPAGRNASSAVSASVVSGGAASASPSSTAQGAAADQPSELPAPGDSMCTIMPAAVIHNVDTTVYHVVATAPYGSVDDNGSKLSKMIVDGKGASCSYGNAAIDKHGNPTDGTPYFSGKVEVHLVSDINAQYQNFVQGDVCMQRERMSPGSCPMTTLGNATAFQEIYQDGQSPRSWTIFLMDKRAVVTATWPGSVGDLYSNTWAGVLVDRLRPP
jgi:hypothetical protein